MNTYASYQPLPQEPAPPTPKRRNVGLVILWILVLLSLALNALLLLGLNQARLAAKATLTDVRNSVAQWSRQPLVFNVKVDRQIPLSTTIPISRTVTVPLDIDYPLSTVINTSVNLPVLGTQAIALPIETIIPIHYTLEVPLVMDFPVSLTYHLEAEIPVEVEIPADLRTTVDAMLEEAEKALR